MFDLDNWQEIWVTISRNKFRSFLTGFGVFWGIFMLLGFIAVSNGFKGGVHTLVEGFAENACFFSSSVTSEPFKGYKKGRFWEITNKDLSLIAHNAQSVQDISPVLLDFDNSSNKNITRNKKSGLFSIRGVYPAQFIIEKQNILSGRLISDGDVKYQRKVCVIGKEVYEALFAIYEEPIGEYINIKGLPFQVVGVISPLSSVSMGDAAEATVFVPFSTMQSIFVKKNIVHYLACTAKPKYTAAMVEEEVKGLLQEAHYISPTDEKAINIFNIEREFMIFNSLFEGSDILILIVGLGSLLSGIIGVINIMLVTVKERTREIGVRRALGAKPSVIVRQIMSESFMLTAISGVIGLVFGVFVLEIVQLEMSRHSFDGVLFIPPFISFTTAVLALGTLCIAGLLAGLIPSIRALSIKAIDAIREE